MSDTTTRGVRIQVAPRYHPERSDPVRRYWFFSYTVRISNLGDQRVQLLSRHWIITDGTGREQQVRGPGVVGATPVLDPGEAFTYTSYCPLPTSLGSMYGSFRMRVLATGEEFDANIDPFVLEDPDTVN